MFGLAGVLKYNLLQAFTLETSAIKNMLLDDFLCRNMFYHHKYSFSCFRPSKHSYNKGLCPSILLPFHPHRGKGGRPHHLSS